MKRLALAASIVLTAGAAHAQTASPGFTLNRFEPSERGSDWFTNESLDLRGKVRPALGVVGDYSNRPLAAYDSNGDLSRAIVRHQFNVHVGGALTLFNRLRLALSLPVALYNEGESATVAGVRYNAPASQQGIGDLRIGADLRLAGTYGGAATLAIGAQLWAPTGSKDNYLSDGAVRVAPRLLLAGQIGAFEYAARMGVNIRAKEETVFNTPVGTELFFGAAAGVAFANRRFLLGPELFGSTVLVNGGAFEKRSTPMEALLGLHYRGDAFRAGIGGGLGLTRGFGSPLARVLATIEWAPGIKEPSDRDKDGILDQDDACPDVYGHSSADPKKHGCPDRDGDGVLDQDDACPEQPGVPTDDPATNGCPPDRDHDGILDQDDACPDEAGKPNKDPKKHGCPERDRDGDGVMDDQDACPDKPGIKTDDPATNGCPHPDRDGDGILNDDDACPDEPGKPNKDPKRNGCPMAYVQDGQIKILEQVKFKTNSAQIVPGKDSEEILQEVLRVLTEHPEIKKVSVEGHTDSRGNAASNKKLSAARAASVVTWLTKKGIEKERLSSAGYGQERPIATNDTDAGRQANRRVEFHIVTEDKPADAK